MKRLKVLAMVLVAVLMLTPVSALAETSYNMTWNNNPNPATWTGNHWGGTYGGWIYDMGTEGLFQFSRLTDHITYRLASEVSHSGNVTTIKMVENGKYSDGQPITAKDIWAYYQMHREVVTQYLEKIEVVDDHTLNFVFLEPAPFEDMRVMLISLNKQAAFPYHIFGEFADKAAEIWEKAPVNETGNVMPWNKDITGEALAQEWADNWNAMTLYAPADGIMVSSGPYIQEALTESDLVLKKNPNYRLADEVKWDKVVSKVTTPEQGIAMLKSAETDCYPGSLPLDVALDVLASNEDIVFYPTVDPACHGLYFNMNSQNAPTLDIAFRKALNYLIDKTPAREVGNYYGQEFRWSNTGIPPMFIDRYVSDEVKAKMTVYEQSAEKAEQTLLDAGYTRNDAGKWLDKDGKQITLTIGVNGSWQPAAVVGNVNMIVAEQFTEFGIDTEVMVAEQSIYQENRKAGVYDMNFEWIDVAWSFAYPYFPLRDLYDSDYARIHMQLELDQSTNKPNYAPLEMKDINGEPIDPIQVLLKVPYMESEEERLAACEELVWLANEYCLGINLYQNCTGIWENRAHTEGLPYADQIDANDQFMPVPAADDPELEKIAGLNWGFTGYNKLFYLTPKQ